MGGKYYVIRGETRAARSAFGSVRSMTQGEYQYWSLFEMAFLTPTYVSLLPFIPTYFSFAGYNRKNRRYNITDPLTNLSTVSHIAGRSLRDWLR